MILSRNSSLEIRLNLKLAFLHLVLIFVDSIAVVNTFYGVSFSPAGLLTPYHVGVWHRLKELKIIQPQTKLYGASGGALVAISAALDLSTENVMNACVSVASECSEFGTIGNLRSAVDRVLHALLPNNSHSILDKLNATVAYRSLYPENKANFVDSFESKEDLIEVLRASCCIPFYFSKSFGVVTRGSVSIDGFFAYPKRYVFINRSISQ